MTVSSILAKAYRANNILITCGLSLESDTGSFEAHAPSIADTLKSATDIVGEIIDGLDTLVPAKRPSCEPHGPAMLYDQWKALRASQRAIAANYFGSPDNPPELDQLVSQCEALSQQIARCVPKTDADAAAMLEWCIQDSNGAILSDLYPQAQRAVIDYLTSKGGSLSLVA